MLNRRMFAPAVATFCSLAARPVRADPVNDIVGTWRLVSADARRNGYRILVFGENPSGTLIFGPDGHYALVFLRRDLPSIGSHDRTAETPEESQAITQGSIAHFGTYQVETDTLVFNIMGGTFPNWTGASQRRKFTLSNDVLTYSSPGSSGHPVEVVMKREVVRQLQSVR